MNQISGVGYRYKTDVCHHALCSDSKVQILAKNHNSLDGSCSCKIVFKQLHWSKMLDHTTAQITTLVNSVNSISVGDVGVKEIGYEYVDWIHLA
jgi:hypothetical protein